MTVDSSTTGIQCSFAGGCELKIFAKGLSASLENPERSYVDICG